MSRYGAVLLGWLCSLAAAMAQPVSASSSQESANKVVALVEAMKQQGSGFNPAPLLELRGEGTRGVLDRIFPETIPSKKKPGKPKAIDRLIVQLGDESFLRREEASTKLRRFGRPYADKLRKATQHEDPEVCAQARKILESWDDKNNNAIPNLYAAFEVYLKKLTDVSCQQEVARRTTVALQKRLDLTPKEKVLKQCLSSIARWRTDQVHNELLPLLKHEDPVVPMFAIRGISGRTGNSYVARIHMGALDCGRRDVIKCALRSMPCPVWDRQSKPKIRKAYIKIFDGKDKAWDFSDDAAFMRLSAFVAARDFRLVEARDYLLERISSKDTNQVLDALHSLGDTYYYRRPIYPELLEKLGPHLKSSDPKLRAAAVATLGVYRGKVIPPLLIDALGDKEAIVWKLAKRRLLEQHSSFPSDQSPIPELLRKAKKTTDNAELRSRLEKLLISTQKPGTAFP